MRYVLRGGALVEKHLAPPKHAAVDARRYVISDTMAPTKHMGTGRIHDSKSEFRKDTRALGLEEVGTDRSRGHERNRYQPTTGEIVQDVKRSIDELRSR
jgi:hypothetical protein